MPEIFELIADFNQMAALVAKQFYNKYHRTDLLSAYHEKIIPKEGKLGILKYYSFHGIGIYAEIGNVEIDFDFGPGPENKSDGFDCYRLAKFAKSNLKYSRFKDELVVNSLLEKLAVEGSIFLPQPSRNYYLDV